jgi:hypothetical protein
MSEMHKEFMEHDHSGIRPVRFVETDDQQVVNQSEVAPVRTYWKPELLIKTIRSALSESFGFVCPDFSPCIVLAQFTLECGRNSLVSGLNCWNYNCGNVRGVSRAGKFHELKGAWELNEKGERYYPKVQKFRAYDSFEESVREWCFVMSSQRNFHHAFEVLKSPAPSAVSYVESARIGGYFTGDLKDYIAAVVSMSYEFSKLKTG